MDGMRETDSGRPKAPNCTGRSAAGNERVNSMNVGFHPHAKERIVERGATEAEVSAAVRNGERFPAKFGRTGFRRNFPFDSEWRGRRYATKQIEAYAVKEGTGWLVITVVTRYF